jgi:GntR family L-lactate dehydrogenase operon transcriptional regulator
MKLADKEIVEFELFKLLADNKNPTGSVTLSLLLRDKGLNVSSATLGRMLIRFVHQGFTEKHGVRGRALTDMGMKRFEELGNKQRLTELSFKFYESIDTESKDNLIDVLIARRGIERETVRLAALRATREELQNLKKIYDLQSKDAAKGLVAAENDVLFHQAIGKASKSNVLTAAYDFIWQNGRFSPVMGYIRRKVGGIIAADHGKILNAIVEKDADEAVKCMTIHIDSLINDVQKYWNLVHGDTANKTDS